MLDDYTVRYGETFDLEVESDDLTAISASFYVGNPGELPVMTITAPFEDGIAYLSSTQDDTRVPLGDYKYQLTVNFPNDKKYKYPTSQYCEEYGLPNFYVLEALDETEVVS